MPFLKYTLLRKRGSSSGERKLKEGSLSGLVEIVGRKKRRKKEKEAYTTPFTNRHAISSTNTSSSVLAHEADVQTVL